MMEYRWARTDELPYVATLFARIVALDESYISHGEIQTGLSLDGEHWVADLPERLSEDLASLGPDRSVAVAVEENRMVGAAIILWEVGSRTSFMVIEDLAVDPSVRAHGVGGALVDFAQEEGVARGMRWAFLESGLHNEGAHRFFERHGFAAISKTFSKRLAAAGDS